MFDELARASLESELNAIRDELAGQGYLRRAPRRGMKEEKLPPLKYRSDDGFTILCGRNNLQNDRLTLKDSRNGDLWLHTQKIPGSHVVVVTEGKTPPDRTIGAGGGHRGRQFQGAGIGQGGGRLHRNPQRAQAPRAGKPGLVLYEPYQTAVVAPDLELAARLLQGR